MDHGCSNDKAFHKSKDLLLVFVDEKRVDGIHNRLRGNVSGLSGDANKIPIDAREEKPNVSDWTE